MKHGRLCPIPEPIEDLLVQGFDCKPYSRQNPLRFSDDVTLKDHPTLEAAVQHMSMRKPKFSILENTRGIKSDPQQEKRSQTPLVHLPERGTIHG